MPGPPSNPAARFHRPWLEKAEGLNVHALVSETGRSARIDDYYAATGGFADVARDWEFRASVGVPIWVGGRLWGVMSAGSRSEPLPASTEVRREWPGSPS